MLLCWQTSTCVLRCEILSAARKYSITNKIQSMAACGALGRKTKVIFRQNSNSQAKVWEKHLLTVNAATLPAVLHPRKWYRRAEEGWYSTTALKRSQVTLCLLASRACVADTQILNITVWTDGPESKMMWTRSKKDPVKYYCSKCYRLITWTYIICVSFWII